MAHEIKKTIYDLDVDKTAVQEFWDNKAHNVNNGENSPGLYESIDWKDLIFDSYDDANKWIDDNDKEYWQVAVKFKTDDLLKHSSDYKKLAKIIKSEEKQLNSLENKVYYSSRNVKFTYITCKNCKSKVATRYIRSNYCPVCNLDLRPDRIENRVRELSSKIHKDKFQLARMEQKDIKADEKTTGLKWLVKTEYHI